jgi:hypothetical protein
MRKAVGHMTNPKIPPATINENGTRIVIETNYMPSADRCQMIFERIGLGNGERGWKISLCWPGIPTY